MEASYKSENAVCAENSAINIIEARCLGVSHRTRQRQEIFDVSGQRICESSIMPTVYIQDKIAQMREEPSLNLSERYARLKKAAHIYQEETLAGLNAKEYAALVSSITGLQESIITESIATISYALFHMSDILQAATPTNAVWDYTDAAVNAGCSFFSRRGDVVSIIAAGNGPGVHALWPQAIAMGYRTLVKPSSREPFTAQRLVYALELAGLAEYIALIPTDHKGAETLISQSDLAIVYGGADVAARYSHDPQVLVQGPGRSKIVVGKDISHEEAVMVAAQSVLSLGGAACVSTSAILVEDNHEAFAIKLKQQIALSSQRAEITLVDNVSDPMVQRELPFPCVTIAPFNQQERCYKALSHSLVVTVLSRQKDLINKVLADASIANVYIGNIPTSWMDFRVPHDGYLADFLMCNRGVRMENKWLKTTEHTR